MKVKMLEYYQGYRVEGALVPQSEYEVDDKLGAYLLEHRKAAQVIDPISQEVTEEKKPAPKAKPRKKAVKK